MARHETDSPTTGATRYKDQCISERDEAVRLLREVLKSGTTVFTILRHVGASGMSRLIDLYIIENNQPLRLTWSVAKALDCAYSRKREALRVEGCGMDVGYHVVYSLAAEIFGDGDALKHRWL